MNVSDYLNLAQGLGILAFCIEIVSFSMKNDKRQIVMRAVSSFVWVFHYHALGKWVPAIIVAVDLLRYATALYVRARPKLIWPVFGAFSLAYLCIGIYFQNTLLDLMPALTGILSCFSMLVLSGIPMRIGFMGVMSSWLVYDFCIHSVGGTINNAVMLTINGITIYRILRDQKAAT
jgi:hypothetical protein